MKNIAEINMEINQKIIGVKRIFPFRVFSTNLLEKEFYIHTDLEFVYILSGSVELFLNEKIYTLDEGDFHLINSNEVHQIVPREKNTVFLGVQIDREFLKDRYKLSKNLFLNNKYIEDRDEVKTILLAIFIGFFTEQYDSLYLLKLLDILMAKLESSIVEERYKILDLSSIDDIVFDILKRIINDELDINFNLQDLSDEYNISYAYLSRKFKSIVGKNITGFLREMKVARSIDYLINTDKNISEISILSGFTDAKSMNRDYRKIFNMSPSEVRVDYRSNNLRIKNYIENNIGSYKGLKHMVNDYRKELIDIESDNVSIDFNKNMGISLSNSSIINNIGVCSYENTYCEFNNMECNILKMKVKYMDGKFFTLKRDGYLKELLPYNYNKYLEYLMEEEIVLVLTLDFISENIEEINKDGGKFLEKAFFDFKENLNLLAMLLGTTDMENWKLEFAVESIYKLEDNTCYLFREFSEGIIKLLREKLRMVNLQWSINLGRIDLEELEYWFIDSLFLRDREFKPDYYTVDLEYKHSNFDLNDSEVSISGLIDRSIEKIKEGLLIDRVDQLWVNLNYRINNKEFHSDSSLIYYNLLLNLIFMKMENNKNYIKSYKVEDKREDRVDIYELCNSNRDIVLTSNYIYDFIEELKGQVIEIGDGFVVTKNGLDVYMLLYGCFKKNYWNIKDIDLPLKNKVSREVNVKLKGLRGKYKFTEFRVDSENSSYYNKFIEETGLIGLNSAEKSYIESRTFPDMNIYIKEIENELEYKLNYEPMEIIFIKGQKI